MNNLFKVVCACACLITGLCLEANEDDKLLEAGHWGFTISTDEMDDSRSFMAYNIASDQGNYLYDVGLVINYEENKKVKIMLMTDNYNLLDKYISLMIRYDDEPAINAKGFWTERAVFFNDNKAIMKKLVGAEVVRIQVDGEIYKFELEGIQVVYKELRKFMGLDDK